MIALALALAFLALTVYGFLISRTTKELPKTWLEWQTEFRFQYIGIVGLIDDFVNRRRDRVTLYKQPGRVAVITGGNRGIGLKIIEKLLACDMTVIMGVRDTKSALLAVSNSIDLNNSGGTLICETLDVGELPSVREFAQKIKAQYGKVHILINNAGIMFAPFRTNSDGYESHFAINYLGHFLLTHLLLPQLKAAGQADKNARIVNVSSCVNLIGRINYHDINGSKKYHPAIAYSQSKLAQILATRHLQRLLDAEKAHVQVHAVHPGIVDTDLFEHSATTSAPLFKKIFFKTPEQGSRTVVFAAIDPSIEAQGGTYFSNGRRGNANAAIRSVAKCERLFNFTCDLLKIKQYGREQQ